MQSGKGRARRGSWSRYRRLILICSLAGLLLVGGTFAFLARMTNDETNTFTFGSTDIKIDEDFDGWTTKKVQLENVQTDTAVPGVVRAMLVPVMKVKVEEGGKDVEYGTGGDLGILGAPGAGSNEIVLGDLTFVLDANWRDNWFYKDNYYYYKTVLNPGDTTAPLLQKVRLTLDDGDTSEEAKAALAAVIEKYKDVIIEVEVMADILQAEGGAPAEAWGLKVEYNESCTDCADTCVGHVSPQ